MPAEIRCNFLQSRLDCFMVDDVCEPFMVRHGDLPILRTLFGTGKGSGAALMMFILGVTGSLICVIVGGRLKKYHYNEM